MRVLVVDDEPALRESLRRGLAAGGWSVETAPDGEAGLEMACGDDFDVVVLDIMMPRRSGYEVVREMRQRGIWTPVLMLTAKDGEYDEADAFDLGADDYLVKPFSFAELLARVRIILRRGHAGNESTTLRVADLELDLLRRRVSRNGKRIDLTAKEFGLLELLMRRHGEVLPRSLIASQVWDMNFDSDTNVIEVAMRRLRVKIDEGHAVKLIQTVRGMGYVLDVPEEE